MFKIVLSELGSVGEKEYTRVVMAARYKGKWIFCKHKDRTTWELPGGHIENGESWQVAAKRELYEETGASEADIEPVCIYKISSPSIFCFADVKSLGKLPSFEIEKIDLFDDIPKNLTYPDSHKKLFDRVVDFLKTKK